MGSGIAQVATFAGIPCVLADNNEKALESGLFYIKSIYNERVKKGKMSESDAEKRISLVTTTTNLAEFSDADLIIEAVFEDLEIKKNLFIELDKICQPGTILATNTSSLPISSIAAATKRPEKVIGIHFFYPAPVMKLVEVIPALQTSQETIDTSISLCESFRKIPVKVKDSPGFLVNRILMPYLYEAIISLEDTASTPQKIDDESVKFGMPMGPFLLVDTLGLDVCYHVAHVLFNAYGPRAAIPPLVEKLYKAKRLGKKSGAGIYEYDGRSETISKFLVRKSNEEFSINRLLFAMVNEAAMCLEENVSSPGDIDLAMIAGVGFPQSTGGLLHWADKVGLDKILGQLKQFSSKYGPRFWPSTYIQRLVGAGFMGAAAKKGFFDY